MKRRIVLCINISLIVFTICTLVLFPTKAKAALLITRINPNTISNQQNNTITINGTDFQMGAIVSLNGYGTLNTSFFSNTTLLAIVPSGITTGTYTVTVTNPDQVSSSLVNALTVITSSPTVVITQTVEPPNGYKRPVLVVNSYSMSQEKISPGNSFILYVTLYNAGQLYAKNILATFVPGDFIPRETGGVVAVGEIAPGNRLDFSQPLIVSTDVWGTLASINMLVSYADDAGILFNETYVITLPVYQSYASWTTATPTPTTTPTPSHKPQLVITNYASDIDPLQSGVQFTLSMLIKNMGNSTAKGVTMIVGGGSSSSGSDGGTQQPGGVSGGSGEFTNFAPIGSSNVQSLGDFTPGTSLTADQTLIVNTSTSPGAYPLKISFVYYDEHNHSFTDDQVVTLLVKRIPLVDISFYQEVAPLFSGQPSILPLQVVNLGRTSVVLGNMHVSADIGQLSNNSILVGTLESGGYYTLDATYMPDQPGIVDLNVTIDYTNDFNELEVISQTLSIEVMDQPIDEPTVDEGTNSDGDFIPTQPETFLQKIWRFVLGIIGLDSGIIDSGSSNIDQPNDNSLSGEEPIIVPGQPPLKGP